VFQFSVLYRYDQNTKRQASHRTRWVAANEVGSIQAQLFRANVIYNKERRALAWIPKPSMNESHFTENHSPRLVRLPIRSSSLQHYDNQGSVESDETYLRQHPTPTGFATRATVAAAINAARMPPRCLNEDDATEEENVRFESPPKDEEAQRQRSVVESAADALLQRLRLRARVPKQPEPRENDGGRI
jgi:hypothetical protein